MSGRCRVLRSREAERWMSAFEEGLEPRPGGCADEAEQHGEGCEDHQRHGHDGRAFVRARARRV